MIFTLVQHLQLPRHTQDPAKQLLFWQAGMVFQPYGQRLSGNILRTDIADLPVFNETQYVIAFFDCHLHHLVFKLFSIG